MKNLSYIQWRPVLARAAAPSAPPGTPTARLQLIELGKLLLEQY